MAAKNIDGAEPVFKEDKVTIMADDGTNLVLRTLNPYYDSKLRPPISKPLFNIRNKRDDNNNVYQNILGECFYFLLCDDETHILLMFDADKNYPQKQKENMALVKYGDFNTTPVYIFSYIDSKYDQHKEMKVWIDKENDKFCGTYMYPYIHFDTNKEVSDDGKDYYNFMRYFFIFEIEKELKRCNEIFTNNVDYEINREIFYGEYAFKIYDKEMEDNFAAQLAELLKNEWKFKREEQTNLMWIQNRCMSVSEVQKFYKMARVNEDFAETRPDIAGDLPTTNGELKNFLDWRTSNFVVEPVLKDRQGTPIIFEIVSEGLKATSAGPDKEIGTDDDIVFVRTYESVGMKPLN